MAEKAQSRMKVLPMDRALTPLPENLFLDPIEYMRADHFRLEALAELLPELFKTNGNGDVLDADKAAPIIGFLETDLPNHLADEEEDLLPILVERLKDNSELVQFLKILTVCHERQDNLAAGLSSDLRQGLEAGSMKNPRRYWRLVGAFEESLRWMTTTEDRVLFNLAGRLLSTAERADLGRAMAARRHTAYPG